MEPIAQQPSKEGLLLEGDEDALKQFNIINQEGLLVVRRDITLQKVFKYFLLNKGFQGFVVFDFKEGFVNNGS